MTTPQRKPPVPDDGTRARQAMASDPGHSAWVAAHAGSGKTWVLSTRVIRMLLAGIDPSRILCLTYTKAAASEMKNRVFERLAAWATLPAGQLAAEIAGLTGMPAPHGLVAHARTLFARALETPGGLKIQTIHAFCEALLHRFPLEANIAGHFEMLDETGAGLMMAEARRSILAGTGNSKAHEAIMTLLAITGESGMEKLLDEIIRQRQTLRSLIDALGESDDRRGDYRAMFGLDREAGEAAIMAGAWPLPGFAPAEISAIAASLDAISQEKAKTARKFVAKLARAAGASSMAERWDILEDAFLDSNGNARGHSGVWAKDALAVAPDIQRRVEESSAHFLAVRARLHLFREVEATQHVLDVADAMIDRYEALKRARGFLDFEDLIRKTAAMLQKEGASAWVRYKLDQGIDHVLVDEAQDTSPAQWQVIHALAGEFFSPGSSRAEEVRTVFAVGDEKQSIYSFQGADPAEFSRSRTHFETLARNARQAFEPLGLEASFRSTKAVLDAVDRVFDLDANRDGLTVGLAPIQPHVSLRKGEPGRVEIWAKIRDQKSAEPDDWDVPAGAETKAAVKVADRIATTIAGWLETGTVIESTGAPMTAGDILVLVRNRSGPFVATLSRRLKELGVAVAGADRLKMAEHLAFKDLVALARVLMQPADDLSLAALLKSPLFGFDEDGLFALAHGRGSARLFDRLADAPEGSPARLAHGRLSDLAARARRSTPHGLFSHVLSALGGRERLAGRLGPETGDVLDEFMALTLAAEQTGIADLQRFIAAIETDAPEIKREMDRAGGAVRIMTVHGAKGLEAPVVFLVDRGGKAFNTSQAPSLLASDRSLATDPAQPALLWRGLPDTKSPVVEAALERARLEAEREHRRLLYVGMTRAADRLVICGHGGVNKETGPVWHDMVRQALEGHCDTQGEGDDQVWTFPKGLGAVPAASRPPEAATAAAVTMRKGFADRARPEPPPARPLTPSGASALAADAGEAQTGGDRTLSLLERGPVHGRAGAALAGTVTHTLLQVLPGLAPEDRHARALAYGSAATGLSGPALDALVDPVMAVLADPALSDLFGPQTRAEVPVMGLVALGGTERALSGVIDRIAVTDEAVTLADYKTNRVVPEGPDALPEVHVRQMALYRALVAPLWPGRAIRCVLVYTGGPVAIGVPDSAMDAAMARLAQS